MDDEAHGTGLGRLAWFQLGKMSAETDRVRSDAVDAVLRRRRPRVDTAATASYQALLVENAQLRQDLEAYRHNYNKLNGWAEEAERDLKRFRGQ